MLKLCEDGNYRVSEWEDYRWLQHGFGARNSISPQRIALVKQIHSAEILIADKVGFNGTGDALISATSTLPVGILTADCLPILIIDTATKVVAAVHAGWRGTIQDIAVKTAMQMSERFGASFGSMEAAIGPGIGKCCFQVGPEVAHEFGSYESDRKTYLDLSEINRSRLAKAGIRRIYQADDCTFCGSDRLFSYRKEKEELGRMLSYVGIREERTNSLLLEVG